MMVVWWVLSFIPGRVVICVVSMSRSFELEYLAVRIRGIWDGSGRLSVRKDVLQVVKIKGRIFW
jgi:hypothetical protein